MTEEALPVEQPEEVVVEESAAPAEAAPELDQDAVNAEVERRVKKRYP